MAYDTKDFWNKRGFNDLGGYTPTPYFLSKELMLVGIGIPPLFWKFTTIAWRCFNEMEKNAQTGALVHTMKFTFTAEQVADDFGIHKAMTNWCAAAYSVAGFCKLEKGRRYNFKLPGVPSTIHYHPNTRKEDWIAFVAALKVQRRDDRRQHYGGHDDGFRVSLAWKVQIQRKELGLPVSPGIEKFLATMKEQGVITKMPDGSEGVARTPAKEMPKELVTEE